MHEKARKETHQPPSVAKRGVTYLWPQSHVSLAANAISLHRINEQRDILLCNGKITNANLSY